MVPDEDTQQGQQGASSSDPMDSLYRDFLSTERPQASPPDSQGQTDGAPHLPTGGTASVQSQNTQRDMDQSEEGCDCRSERQGEQSGSSESSSGTSERQSQVTSPVKINISQPIGSLCAVKVRSGGPLTVRGEIETLTEDEIQKNCETEEGIRSIPRFRNYQPGKPSKVSPVAPPDT